MRLVQVSIIVSFSTITMDKAQALSRPQSAVSKSNAANRTGAGGAQVVADALAFRGNSAAITATAGFSVSEGVPMDVF